MAKKELLTKAVLTTKEVAWSSGKPTKWQSAMEYQVSEKRIIRISGDPMSNKEKALDSLCAELLLWEEAMAAFKKVNL